MNDTGKNLIPDRVRVRFAPSPTGSLHVGSARTMLYNWLVARRYGGTVLLRIEDTDRLRSGQAEIDEIVRVLEWLGLDHDQQVLQSSREAAHQQALDQLLDAGLVYQSEARQDDVKAWKQINGADRGFRGREESSGSYRLRLDAQAQIVVDDLIRGRIVFETEHIDDVVIARSDRSPLYNLAVAVDDADVDIQLVIRGDDHISNTPKQAAILAALGRDIPLYAHLPLIHGQDGRKLSKSHKAPDGTPAAITVEQLRAQGHLPEAVLGYLAGLGWGGETEQLYSLDQLIDQFDLTKVAHNPARFDPIKLRQINADWIKLLSVDDFINRVEAFIDRPIDARLRAGLLSAKERSRDLGEARNYVAWSWEGPADDPKAWRKHVNRQSKASLIAVSELLQDVDWEPEAITDALGLLAEELDLKPLKLFQPIRVALTGRAVSLPIGATIALLDRDQAVARLVDAVAQIS